MTATPKAAVEAPVPSPVEAPATLDTLVLARVRLRARRRAAWLQHVGADAGLEAWLRGHDTRERERSWRAEAALHPLNEQVAHVEAALAAGPSRLSELESVFALEPAESDYVQACLAVSLDPEIGRLFAYLGDHPGRAYPAEPVVARLFDHGLPRVLTPESPLLRWEIVRKESAGPGEPEALWLDPHLRDWLLGQNRLDETLVGAARLVPPREPLPRWPVDEIAQRIQGLLGSARARVGVVGPPDSGRRTLAAAIASRLGLPLLLVDSSGLTDDAWRTVFLRAQRQAFLDRTALAWTGEAAVSRTWPSFVAPFPVQFLIAEAGDAPAARSDVVDFTVEMPALSVAERTRLWRALVPGADSWPEADVAQAAVQHRLTPGEIASLAPRAPRSAAEATDLLRHASRHRLGELARSIECPFTWDDLVLPDSLRRSLADFVYEAKEREAFWEQHAVRRLFPQGRGLFALFSGSPGTGKTMAAQVIAAALGLDLFRISLAAVVSKYVGETTKNLHRLLARAEAMDAVLLFDEADALFGRRTEIKDAHDRFANMDTDFLLQAVEAYRGVAILATNKKSNMDPAFTRRLRYVLEFPRPDAEGRCLLWTRLLTELAGADAARALARDVEALAEAVDMSGAQIKYALLAALFAARRHEEALSVRHLVHGLERELGKEGRALSERERERLTRHG